MAKSNKLANVSTITRPRKGSMRSAYNKAIIASNTAMDAIKPNQFEIKRPMLAPGVAPSGTTPPVMAMDDGQLQYLNTAYCGCGFPGYPYLAQLATRGEFIALAATKATELTRKWIEFTSTDNETGDTAEKIKAITEEMARLDVRGIFNRASIHDDYFGRGQIFIDIEGADRKTPLILDSRTIKKGSLKRVSTVEAIWTTPVAYNALDPIAPDFYKPSKWFMLGQEVHASRLMTIISRELPDILKPAYNFGGMSLSQMAEPYVDAWLSTRSSIRNLLTNFSTTALKTSMDQVLQGGDGADIVSRAQLFTANRSNQGLMLLDKDREELVQINTPLSGLHELQAQAQEHLCSISRTPAIILTGISPSGLNATSEGEIEVFYNWINAQQESFWRFPLETIIKVIQLSLFGEIDPSISFKFVPLHQMKETDQADIRQKDGATAVAYIQEGVLDPSEVRERLANDPDSGYQGLDLGVEIVAPNNPEQEEDPTTEAPAEDKSVSEAQHKAMEAAAHGTSNLCIPKKVGEEFVSKDGQEA